MRTQNTSTMNLNATLTEINNVTSDKHHTADNIQHTGKTDHTSTYTSQFAYNQHPTADK